MQQGEIDNQKIISRGVWTLNEEIAFFPHKRNKKLLRSRKGETAGLRFSCVKGK